MPIKDSGWDKSLSPTQLRRARRRAATRAAVTGRKDANKVATQETGLQSSAVSKATKAQRGTITAEGGPRNLAYYRARQLKRGVRAQPYGVRRLFPGTFFINGKVFHRVRDRQNPNRGGRLTKHSEGIEPLWGPGIAAVYLRVVKSRRWVKLVQDRFLTVLRQEIRFRRNK